MNPMIMKTGNRWTCANPGCRAEVLVLRSSEKEYGAGIRCSCGYTMKKTYEKPAHRKASMAMRQGAVNGS